MSIVDAAGSRNLDLGMIAKLQLPASLHSKVVIGIVTDPFRLRPRATFTLPDKRKIECYLDSNGTIPAVTMAELCLLA